MQELNELKNLVIQSLESNGALSNIRAQIRASVFKVIDSSETNTKKESNYNWENQKCGQALENPEGKLVLLLIKELLQFYKMDYSLSVFSSEATLREDVNREQLGEKCQLNLREQNDKPLLWLLLEGILNQDNTQKSLQEAKNLIKKNETNIKSGKVAELQVSDQKEQNLAVSGEYGEVDENIDYDDEDQFGKKSQLRNESQALQSSDVIGASQSQGFDMSVDSLALEDYDYFEDVEEDNDFV